MVKTQLHRYFAWTFYSCLVGIVAGLAASIFLYSLNWITEYRKEHLSLVWGLPIIGFAIGWLYLVYGKEISRGHNLILEEIHNPKKVIPLRMAPLIYLSTVLTHLFGGSAGREGTAVQMGASLADQLSKVFRIEPHERKILLMAGTGAGFSAAIGAPWAGAVFAMEVIHIGRIKIFALFEILVSSFVAYYTAIALNTPHSVFPQITTFSFDFKTLVFVFIAGVFFGMAVRIFVGLTHTIENTLSRIITYSPLKPFIAGLIILALFYLVDSLDSGFKYAGLGLEVIQNSLSKPSSLQEPFLKTLFTSLTIGSGFKGGEFIPLVFVGSTLGSALSIILPISFQLLASLGFAAVFAGASNTPLACTIMAMEIFGYQIGPYALIACLTSYYFSGQKSIYKSQKIYQQT
jgi:H+/Cl- antiporter ClcA